MKNVFDVVCDRVNDVSGCKFVNARIVRQIEGSFIRHTKHFLFDDKSDKDNRLIDALIRYHCNGAHHEAEMFDAIDAYIA